MMNPSFLNKNFLILTVYSKIEKRETTVSLFL